MNKRQGAGMRLMAVLYVLLGMALFWLALPTQSNAQVDQRAPGETSQQPPNILLIISDDQAWTDFGFMGHSTINTPTLDRLARNSCTFTRGYVPTALCRPSLATMITGLYPYQHRIVGNDPSPLDATGQRLPAEPFAKLRERLISRIDDVATLPKLLQAKGYASFQTGKWWEGPYSRGGFTDGMTHGDPQRGGRHGDQGLTISRKGIEPIREFLDGLDEQPFFIWHAPFLPHTPHTPPESLLAKYQASDRPLALARYYAMCDWFDKTCDELLQELETRDLAQDTLVIFVTDNGWIQATPELDLPKGWRYAFAPRSKQSPYEGGIRTPIMFRWPGRIAARMNQETLVSSLDIAPTILDIVGVETPDSMRGLSLKSHLLEDSPIQRTAIFGEGYAHDVADLEAPSESLLYRWVIDGPWKLIQSFDGERGRYRIAHPRAPEFQLFQIKDDPHEHVELSERQPGRVAAMASLLREHFSDKQHSK